MTAVMRAIGSLRLIFIDASPVDVALAVRQLEASGLEFSWVRVDSRGALLSALDTWLPDLVLSEVSLPGWGGLEALAVVRDRVPDAPFLIVAGAMSDETAVECLKAGAWVVVRKEHPSRLPCAVNDALEMKRARDKARADRLDITDLLHAEAERGRYASALAQAQKMQAVGRLAGGVSHDFNNLLTGILGYCDLLLSSIPEEAPYRADVVQIQHVAKRASTLTRQLLAFSRRQVMSPVALNLSTLLADMAKPVRTMLRENLELVWDLAPGLEDIHADPAQVEQALYNLLMNASDAMPDGGRISVRTYATDLEATSAARHSGTRKGRHVAVSVRDTGVGIDPGVLPLVFEPFVTTKPPGQGNGLGLAAVYGIVKQSHGCVIAESRPGEGATFTMFFPVVAGEPGATRADEPETVGSPGGQTVLLVEDDEALRPVLRRVLEGRGYEVLEAVDGVDAVDRWRSQALRLTVLLTDLVMPRRDGVEVARLFREVAPALPVLFMTAYAEPEVFRDVVEDERTMLIKKPFLPGALVSALRRLLHGRSAAAAEDS